MSLGRGVMFVTEERRHYALCVRSFYVASKYSDEAAIFYAHQWGHLDEDAKNFVRDLIARSADTAKLAQQEIDSGFQPTKRHKVISLAAIVENLIESYLELFFTYYDDDGEALKVLTDRRPKNMLDPMDVRRSVRIWERSFGHRRRSDRVDEMIRFFVEDYRFPIEIRAGFDGLFAVRNRLVHELIVSDAPGDHFALDEADHRKIIISDDEMESYFKAAEEFLGSLLETVKSRRTSEATRDC